MTVSDRAALAARNRALAAQKHRPSERTHVRRALLRLIGRAPLPPLRNARNDAILLIRPDHVGDVLFITPAVRALRAALPEAEITALVGPWSAGVLAPFPEVDHVVTLRFPGFTRSAKGGPFSPYRTAWRTARTLRQMGVGAAVVMRPDHWWGAMAAHLARIPVRVGYDLPDVAPFLTEPARFDAAAHSVRLNLKLVERWTGPVADADAPLRFPVAAEDAAYIDAYLAERGCAPEQRVVVIHAGAGSAYKTWLPDHWASVGDALARRHSARVVLTGSAREAVAVREIALRMAEPPIVAAGDTTIGQLAALCARARLVLGPDSGPLHLAVAVGAPTVHLYGPADPKRYGPWGPHARHIVLQHGQMACVPCGILDWSGDDPANHPCVRDITVSQVLDAAFALLR
ncbi:MAG: glycosyltransferase family 9 protein [Anaerolineae bacterium]